MKNFISGFTLKNVIVLTLIAFAMTTVSGQNTAKIKNIVIVHGAFADASGWENVYKILKAKGYNITLVQNPLTSLEDDAAATDRAIQRMDGPVVLVGHSWGGTVITTAGNSDKVAKLVYVAAFVPKEGETSLDLIKTAAPAAENGILPPDANGLIYYDKEKFKAGFVNDVSDEKAAFMFASHAPINVKCFITPITVPAWKSKPSFAIVAKDDKSINPEIQRMMYNRAGSTVTEISGSHALFIAKAKAVADVIEAATK